VRECKKMVRRSREVVRRRDWQWRRRY